ncbi:MAG: insulinase family protein [Cyanobacteria bacterium SIG27]|nr:insulinase family protein [Cyanobacteria bacterium SIG27]
MKHYQNNGINILLEKMPKTPRMSVSFFFKINKKEKFFGINSLLARLFLQGTKKYSAVELSLAFENECIDITTKAKQDYLKFSLCFLNEDFNRAMDLVKDLILNSTFDDFEKEVFKLKGEIISDLDNPKMKLTDTFVKNLFKNHPYSSTHTKILEDLDKITKNDIIEAHSALFNCFKSIVVVGDYENDEKMIEYFTSNFDFMKSCDETCEIEDIFKLDIEKDEIVKIVKNDASQAQIIQGWLVDSFNSNLSAKIAVLNNVLGSSGLSSRLFVNLRDKQGLAYTVRSQYETLAHSAIFNMYIGTAPINIQKSLNGFKDELQKLADIPLSDEELTGAKENIQGRLKYFTQNNSQINAVDGYNFMMGLGLDYNERFMEEIRQVNQKDIQDMAKMLLSMPKLITIIAPESAMKEV